MQSVSFTAITSRLPCCLEVAGEVPGEKHLAAPLRAGDLCPGCQIEHLDYDGLLNLACPKCGYSSGGGCYT